MSTSLQHDTGLSHADREMFGTIDFLEILTVVSESWRSLVVLTVLAGALGLAVSFTIPNAYTSQTTFLPPQQQQSAGASALASLGALAGLAGASVAIKSSGDQYISLMQSANVEDRIIDKFALMQLYKSEYRFQARIELEKNVRISLGKKDGIITVEADGPTPQLAADIANSYVSELRRLSGDLALTEAQQRRVFFESQVQLAHAGLTKAQQALQASGFNPSALKAEPKAAADEYARVKAELTAAEIRMLSLRSSLTEATPEVQRQASVVAALQNQLKSLQSSDANGSVGADYVSSYREFKYQETLFDLFSRQYELARVDESREGALIQVIDAAKPPEHKSKPKRLLVGLAAGFVTFTLLVARILFKRFAGDAAKDKTTAARFARLKAAWSWRNSR